MKVIETIYKGFKFRSRLEARWAVFFDTLPIKWEYEKEGFDFGNGQKYLPDFWLPQVKFWAEVKPEGVNFDMDKIMKLVDGTKYPCLLLKGFPQNKSYSAFGRFHYEDGGFLEFCLTNHHGYPENENRFFSSPGCSVDNCPGCLQCQFDDTEMATLAAKQARFEYGESGFRNGTQICR